jgi:hypothetical protein
LKLFLFSLVSWNTSLHAPFAFKASIEKFAVILVSLPLYIICFFFLTACSSLSLFSVLVVLMIICCGVALFWLSLLGVLKASYV